MKYLIASDIHGSSLYLRELLSKYKEEKADSLVLLGDILYHGPRNDLPKGYAPKECIELLNGFDHNILAVRGNCDAQVDQMVLNFPILSDYAVICMDEVLIYLTHGHLALPKFKDKAIVLMGHTHVQGVKDKGEYVCINAGSVSLPKDGNPRTYMVLENRKFTIKTFEGTEVSAYEF